MFFPRVCAYAPFYMTCPGQEPLLREAGIPIPAQYVPKTKSFTLPSPSDKGYGMQILWVTQIDTGCKDI